MASKKKWLRELMDKVKADLVREDGRLERLCKHGIGHTVGHINQESWENDKYVELHGCDGCCHNWRRQPKTLDTK